MSIPKSSWLRWYVKVRRVTKKVCKLHTKRVILNKVAQHEKKYLLNCSVRIYQRIINWSIERVGIYQCFLVINPCVFIRDRHTYQTIVKFNWVQIRGVLKKDLYWGGSAPRSNPLPFYIPFFRKGTPFVYLLLKKSTPFIYLLKTTYE